MVSDPPEELTLPSGGFFIFGVIMYRFFLSMLIVLVLIVLASCASTDNLMNPNAHYKMDMEIENIAGLKRSGVGMITIEDKPLTTLEFTSPGRLSLITIKTCSRDETIEPGGWIKSKKFSYNYKRSLIEMQPACDMEVWGFDAKKGRHALAYVVYESGQDTLMGHIYCGRHEQDYSGTSVCQGHSGTKQKITFQKPVIWLSSDICKPAIKNPEGTEFELYLVSGLCNYLFMSKDGQSHRLVAYGFDETMVRE